LRASYEIHRAEEARRMAVPNDAVRQPREVRA
jgi:hypothetical protein